MSGLQLLLTAIITLVGLIVFELREIKRRLDTIESKLNQKDTNEANETR